eukprot:CAMPEP_0202899576 /NCGR_PEP_ID=MMETSP1392-20130828/7763_1 /ASSEMBLY_ACC=CAM_ASM_000868 /TAXON_ID=225041 /ORGANISM="Chlamydomonas chlamydogama, Strain SAG 11-48b" /LENGTH=106 /DNA_ID=CAMNT_0049585789 /DNA_START=94 /DNA_END=414 /DNA_ORIENTATION=+
MSSAVRRLAQQVPRFTRGFKSSSSVNGGGHGHVEKGSHMEIAYGDGHHGLRAGYNYDYEHGPHYLEPRKVTNFMAKWRAGMLACYALGIGVPCFAVWWQNYKLKAA